METRPLNLWEVVRTSLCFIPDLMIFSAIGLSFIVLAMDKSIEPDHYRAFSLLYTGGAGGIRSILPMIAGSMITVAVIVGSQLSNKIYTFLT